jgi:hydroxymethylbilane synthase
VQLEVVVISTRGDWILDRPLPEVGGKGLFTAELEAALREGRIDLAVHSLKDLPTADPSGIVVGAIPPRASHADALVSRGGHTFTELPEGAVVGTSSRRRAAQLLHRRPDLRILDIRGNVGTRIDKTLLAEGPYDATVLAHAGLIRLARLEVVSEVFPTDVMLPAPGQGALGIQCRDDRISRGWIADLQCEETFLAVTAERAFLAALGGGCSIPVAALGRLTDSRLSLRSRVTAPDGAREIELERTATLTGELEADRRAATALGEELASEALGQGAGAFLEPGA